MFTGKAFSGGWPDLASVWSALGFCTMEGIENVQCAQKSVKRAFFLDFEHFVRMDGHFPEGNVHLFRKAAR